MGIKGLAKWLQTKWPTAFTPKADLASIPFETVCIDVNPLLHRAARKSKNNDQCVKRLFRSLDDLVMRGFNPKSVVCLAVDGPGPLAKIAEQRRRRRAPRIAKKSTFDARQITPGTAFMNSIDSHLNYYACQYLVRTARTKPGLRVIVSGPNVAGEGEVKILGHLVDGRDKMTNLIIGSDNDILLQAIAANVKGTVVLDDDGGVTFSYDDFLSAISHERPDSKPELVALDLAAIILLMGNDYLPKMRKVTFDQLWNCYRRAADQYPKGHLVDLAGESFDVAFLKAIISGIGPRSGWQGPAPSANDELEDEAALDAVGLDPNRWEIDMTPAARRDQSANFLKGIIWCLEMCVNRNCPDYSFEYPFFTAPAPKDLAAFLDEMIADRRKNQLSWPRSTSPAVHPVICAAMLLGADGKEFMDPSWQTLMGVEADRLQVQFQDIIREHGGAAHMSDAGFGRPIELRTICSPNAVHFVPVLPPFANQAFRRPFYRDVLPPTDGHLIKRKTWADRFSAHTEPNPRAAAVPPAEKKRKVNTVQAKMDVDITSPIKRTQPSATRKVNTSQVKMDLDIISPVTPTQPPAAQKGNIGQANARPPPIIKPVCYFFAKQGACRNGHDCGFSHDVHQPSGLRSQNRLPPAFSTQPHLTRPPPRPVNLQASARPPFARPENSMHLSQTPRPPAGAGGRSYQPEGAAGWDGGHGAFARPAGSQYHRAAQARNSTHIGNTGQGAALGTGEVAPRYRFHGHAQGGGQPG
ncbi:hypothetical protein HDU88_001840 [Geranomyces variabilis]|nr:hypothetical protein HDU88_001840 [Geranomyces variabilis]